MKKVSQKGMAHLGIVLLVLVVAVIGFAGYKVEQYHHQNKDHMPSSENGATLKAPQQVTAINSKSDLNIVQDELNRQNIDGDLNPDGFNSDVSSLQ